MIKVENRSFFCGILFVYLNKSIQMEQVNANKIAYGMKNLLWNSSAILTEFGCFLYNCLSFLLFETLNICLSDEFLESFCSFIKDDKRTSKISALIV